MRDKHIIRSCYWCHEYKDMNAIVPTCEYYGEYGSCPCIAECKHYINELEVDNIIREKSSGGEADCGAWMLGEDGEV